jgi:signal recognition particle GTPase
VTTPYDPEVVIIRSGYASDDAWLDAIAQALRAGRRVVLIDAGGRRREIPHEERTKWTR